MSARRILIAAGGTAGHVVPALAVADALRAEGVEVHFAGGDRAEAELVPEAGYPLHRLHLAAPPRGAPLRALAAIATDLAALPRAWRLLGEARPDAVLGAGGYASVPVGVAAAARRVPLVLIEADGQLGVANRVLAPFARRICTALPLAGAGASRRRVTGRPVPPLRAGRRLGRERFGVEPEQTLIVVFGGSQGARSINLAALAAFAEPELAGVPLRVLHAAGERDLPQLRSPGPHYDLRGYIPGLIDALVAADLVVARAGGSVWEIAAAGRPAILIPYPHATQDHQRANARFFVDAGAAVMIDDRELSAERLAAEAGSLLEAPERLAAMARAAAAAARPRAAHEIAAELIAAAR